MNGATDREIAELRAALSQARAELDDLQTRLRDSLSHARTWRAACGAD